jgi:hypothetical protein
VVIWVIINSYFNNEMHIFENICAHFKHIKQFLVPEHSISSNDILMMKFSNKNNEDLVKKIGEFLFKVHEKIRSVINEL